MPVPSVTLLRVSTARTRHNVTLDEWLGQYGERVSEEWRRAMRVVRVSGWVMVALGCLVVVGSPLVGLVVPIRFVGPSTLGAALILVGGYVIVILAATAPVRRRLSELRQSTGAIVELVGLDPTWLPVDGGGTGAHRPGLLIADGTGIRLTDLDQAEVALDAAWSEVTAVAMQHAPRPAVEVELTSRWWFTLWRPAALPDWILPRTGRVRALVSRLEALREASAVAAR
ncbi:hypothetical protein [Schumannella luteola]